MATTFPRFLELPWEIQARIWELSVEPRTVKVRRVTVTRARCSYHEGRGTTYEVVTSTPVPAALQTCYQARYKHRLYQPVFSELDIVRSCEERRYVWLNLDIDTVDAGLSNGLTLFDFKSVARSIRRLKFETAEIMVGDKAALHEYFVNLQELHITSSNEKLLELATMRKYLSGFLPRSLKKLFVHHTVGGFTRQWDESVGDDDPQHIRWVRDNITRTRLKDLRVKAFILSRW
ncbi:hypothetical protein B0H65DRAFT_552899 [Neurospora tetraspora]|uniref:2EXR domain-containing protein n=1 Tax=Neurospora tetraspora TaxID=94610 RepID=A0AAE0J7M5_9PEZI|nr:hypothetical protein B0H65DRAFT_552899 [Neurospora tetraspora]